MMKKVLHQEYNYLNLVRNIINNGIIEKGGKTRSILGVQMNYDLTNNTLPLLTTKKMAWKSCFKELMWFVSGETDNKILQDQNVKIWNGNSNRDFLDSRGLYNLAEDDLGPIYGHQWRHYNAKYFNCSTDYNGKGVDQLKNVIEQLSNKETRNSRRIILNAWNPNQLDEMALPPCHVLSQYIVKNNELTTLLYQRSGDVGLGIPFNIASYSFLTHILSKHCGLKAKEFIHFIGDAHIYEEHIDALKEQINREPLEFPKIDISKKQKNIEDYSLENVKVINYKSAKKVEMDMNNNLRNYLKK